MPWWGLDFGFTHPFTLDGTISSGVFKKYSHPSVFDPDSPDLAFAFHESVLLSSRVFPSPGMLFKKGPPPRDSSISLICAWH